MSALFNAAEVFAMAIQMESNGAAFYRKAAKQHTGKNIDFLLRMATMEDGHQATFMRLRDELAAIRGSAESDLSNEGELYLSAIASGYHVEGSPKIAATLTGKESLSAILRIAIGLEKDAILFYLGVRDVVPNDLGKGSIDHIIAEEKKHVVILTDELRRLDAKVRG